MVSSNQSVLSKEKLTNSNRATLYRSKGREGLNRVRMKGYFGNNCSNEGIRDEHEAYFTIYL